ncbi:TetR/AcrR family transcriptional regulator [Mycolicibacterium sp.]|uniref:TetR/AcrR family transcriptional regulator n=1 Tax=Mycolicibacterium sp. TaxID=2320850 RepID=UPI001A3329E5|nr:TetR/AcrR family transcriptional regulator [Mycolicibacterium sp.]MBJ7399332.1 TetR/AcrR family transcriptional regulator [Mycolicibacterium sp.]
MPERKPDPTGAKILDGAIRVLGDFGVKRATVELVASYAGVSHMTIYRRWPSKNDLLKTAIIGEFTTLLDTAFDQTGKHGTSFAERTLTAFTETVWAVQSHPLALRELNIESSEQLPMLSSTSSAVMEAGVPLVAGQLQRLGTTVEQTPADLDSIADVFVRMGYSLVVVKRPGQLLTTRAEVAEYAGECFGPYLQGLTDKTGLPADDAVVVDLDQHRLARKRSQRPYLQIAVASIFSVLTLGAGLTAVLNGNVKIPFITPAGISKPTTVETPTGYAPGSRSEGPGANSEPQLPGAAPAEPSSPGSLDPEFAARPSAIPAPIPQTQPGQNAVAVVGAIGGNSPDSTGLNPANPVPAAPAPPKPTPGPQPAPGPGPGPQPGPGPGPQPGPGPKPAPGSQPGPGPQPGPKPGPNQQGPNQPGPNQQGPNQPGPNQQGPGSNQSGQGNQSNQQSGRSN